MISSTKVIIYFVSHSNVNRKRLYLVVFCESRLKQNYSISNIVHCRYESYLNCHVAKGKIYLFSPYLTASLFLPLSIWNMLLNGFYFVCFTCTCFSRWVTFMVIFSLIYITSIDLGIFPLHKRHYPVCFLLGCTHIFSTYHLFPIWALTASNFSEMSFFMVIAFYQKLYWSLYIC